MNRILLIGGTGTVGYQVVAQLSERGVPIRVLGRNPEAVSFPLQAEFVRGDLTRPETLDAGLVDIDTVFLVWVAPPVAVVPALEKILRRTRRIVFLSAPLKTPHPLFQQPNAARNLGLQIEKIIETSGCDWTFLRPGMFAANAKEWWGAQIRSGNLVRWPYLDTPTAPIDERDIAAIAVRALCEDGHVGAEYVLTGPQSLSQREQIETIGKAIRRRLQIEELSPEEARRELLPAFPRPVVNMLLDAWAAARSQPAFVSPAFQQIAGKSPRTFGAWATDNVAAFRN